MVQVLVDTGLWGTVTVCRAGALGVRCLKAELEQRHVSRGWHPLGVPVFTPSRGCVCPV